MNICSESHEEIVHEGKTCPLCGALEEIESLTAQLGEYEKERR